ncbi:MAG: hypothetical protein COA78_06615 [Blastopirellula sp.]|nr:MAG: hypothetical protein COA78_06615 [Blastopirellula sp.]
MFGFLNPRTQHLSYRSLYARGCQHLKLSYGVRSLVFHSFESVFLYGYAADVGAFDRTKVPAKRCCKLQASKTLLEQPDRVYGEFTASLSMLLTSIKLEDDILDNNSMLARTAKFGLRKPIQNTNAYFSTIDARFEEKTSSFIQEHHNLERSSRSVTVEELAKPTADGFGYMFEMYSHLPKLEGHRESLRTLGNHVGSAIIAYDCGVDWKRDHRNSDFNPVTCEAEAREALRFSARELRAAARYVQPIIDDDDGISAEVLDTVADRVEHQAGDQGEPQEPFQPKKEGCGNNCSEIGLNSCCLCGDASGTCCCEGGLELCCGCC